jgi:hypothetical protein
MVRDWAKKLEADARLKDEEAQHLREEVALLLEKAERSR